MVARSAHVPKVRACHRIEYRVDDRLIARPRSEPLSEEMGVHPVHQADDRQRDARLRVFAPRLIGAVPGSPSY